MADYSIAAVTRRAVYTGSAGTGPYAFSFAVLTSSDIAVYKNTSKLTETSDYSVTVSATDGTGSVTLGSAADSGDTITLIGARALARTSDFVTAGSLTASALNTDLDSIVIFAQQLAEENTRALTIPATEGISGSTSTILPAVDDRKGKLLQFNSSTGNPEVTTFALSGITASAAELNILDDATLTTAELNLLDGSATTAGTTAVASGDGIVTNDGGTMRQTTVATFDTYLSASTKTLTNKTLTSPVINTGVSGTAVKDEDNMSSNSATHLATQQSIKAYVDSQIATEDTVSELNDTTIGSLSSGHILIYDGSDSWDNKAMSGDATIAADGALTIASTSVETGMLANDCVTEAKIADGAVENEHLNTNVISGQTELASGIADADEMFISDGGTLKKVGLDTMKTYFSPVAGSSSIVTTGTITTGTWQGTAIASSYIAADAITAAKIADDAISEEHLDPTAISGLADTTIASGDYLMFWDVTDSALKKVDAGELGVGSSLTALVGDTSPQLGGTLDCNSQAIDLQGLADGLILDADTDTTISSPTDDQIDFELGGSDIFKMTTTGLTGKVLNTVTAIATGQQSISSTSYADISGATADITCQSSSSKVLVIIACSQYGANSFATVIRTVSGGASTDLAGNSDGVIQTSAASFSNGPIVFLDSPSTTTALTYKVQMKNSTGTTYSGWSSGATKCTVTLIECANGV